jgi:hypothetical protein
MLSLALHAVMLAVSAPLLQDAIVAPPPRLSLPRPAAHAPLALANQNTVSAGRPERVGEMTLEVWIGSESIGTRVAVPIVIDAKLAAR